MFQEIFGKVDKFVLWDMEIIQTDAGTQFTSKESQEVFSLRGLRLALKTTDHQEINGQVEVTWRTFRAISF